MQLFIDQGDGSVELIPVETDCYERTVAQVFVVREDDSEVHLNSQMVMDGYAYHYAQHSVARIRLRLKKQRRSPRHQVLGCGQIQ